MKNATIAVLSAMTMLAMALAPLGTATTPTSSADATIAGPASVDVKGVVGVGVGFCVEEDGSPGVPLDCDNGVGTISGAGAYVHDTSAECASTVGCFYDVWATQVGGAEISGWGITVCTDRNDGANTCTNIGENDDDFADGYFGTTVSGASKDKGSDYAYTSFCARGDNVDANLDGDYDNFFVFIGSWADEDQVFTNTDDNTGAGVGAGQFDIYVDFVAATTDVVACESVLSIVGAP